MRRAWMLLMVGSATMILIGCSPGSSDKGPFPSPSSLKSKGRLPETWAVTSLDGKELDMRELRGKVIFINRWATWCPPCVQEMPSIQALYESLRGSDVVFVVLTKEDPTKVKNFVQKKGWSLPIYVATEPIPPILTPQFLPTSYVVNRKGEVVFEFESAMDWDTDHARKFLKSIP